MTRRVAATVFFLWGCSRAIPGAPEDAVNGFFAALKARDCAALTATVGGALGGRMQSAGCDAVLRDLGRFELERIESASVDGRDRAAWLVRVRVRGKPEAVLVRVEGRAGRWQVVSM